MGYIFQSLTKYVRDGFNLKNKNIVGESIGHIYQQR